MATAAKAAFGVTLVYNSQTVGEILEVNGVKIDQGFIDVTNHASTGGYEEVIAAAVIRSGEFTVKCNSVVGNAGQAAIKAAMAAKTAYTAVITFPDGYVISGSAYVKDYEVISDLENQLIIQHTFKWTGVITESTTSATAPSALVCTDATLYPTFAAGAYEYYGVSTGDTCTFTLTFATSTAKLYREGVFVQNLTSEEASGSVSLGADNTATDFQIVVSEASKADRFYNIHISNAA